jgi:hypothetical protein
VSCGGRLPTGTEIGKGGYYGETYGAEYEDLAYKGLGGTDPPHSWAVNTAPSACFAMRAFNGCCNQSYLILSRRSRLVRERMVPLWERGAIVAGQSASANAATNTKKLWASPAEGAA